MNGPDRGLSRRAFVRSAVAIGGASALAACLQREETEDVPQAALSPEELPDRQHAWNEFLAEDDHGNIEPPEHHLLLGLEYVGDGPADAEDEREQLETAFQTLEKAYKRGNEGLAFTIGYGPAYFDRFETDLPESVDLPDPEALAPIEDPELDEYDALIHLASDYGHVTLSAEEALQGDLEELNGLEVEGTLEGVFDVAERRTGFIGRGLPADRQSGVSGIPDSEPVPDDAPMFMGFKSGFRKTQASEDRVTIRDGPFAGGTTIHLSKIRLHLHQWYEQDSRDIRVSKMFSPTHADEGLVDGAGDNLGDSSRIAEVGGDAAEDARRGTVGHAQKTARAREDGEPIILRRDFDSTDDDAAATHFLSLQRSIADFVKTRNAMTGSDLTDGSISSRTNNGILQYIRVRNRANYLVPPRGLRALPAPNSESA
ncbi:Tat pathway signal protein [Natrinema versiforme]|uniref:Tat pathway signal protein n=1 Tax=Natrinema versiforme TaxID=88724 RepID=A0A4P8WGF0_9EURY|nr:Tat pathway signal protein [Natrinema versiforme]QCS42174.1 Tat pathway signal protein [Natrinema versiforme]